MKAIITGATGMVGGIVLKQCLESNEIKEVISISRRSTGIQHPKLKEVIHKDFNNYEGQEAVFQNVDVAYFCIGVYTGTVADDVFKEITVDYTKSFADKLKAHSPTAKFSFLSGSGADPKEKSRVSFAKYKGMAENYLIAQNFGELYIFRPGYIYPVEKRKEPNAMYRVSRSLYPLLKLFGKNASIKSTELGEAMYLAGVKGANQSIFENKEILNFLDS